ncbi:MAG TPA: o-succinylbenzoate synthase [Planctomycetota bacterium]|nr:o-succinylbenzoate synthase [Planctomycetota bacterium]
MRIDRLELIHLRMPLVHPFETSFGRVNEKETLLVRIESGGTPGWGESPVAAAPGYSYETVQTAWHVIRDFLAPRLKGVEIARAGPIAEFFGFVRGHPMAKAGIEMAVLDLFGRLEGKPISWMLGGRVEEIPTGVSLGIEPRVEDLLKQVERAAALGYRRIKLKIKPRWDVDVVAAVRRKFPDLPLMVDANAAYSLADADHLRRLDDFGLLMIEQPLDPDDLLDHAKLQALLKTPICLDESIKSYADARRAIEAKACRIINIKQARVGGPFAAKSLHDVCLAKGIPVWCGGLLETGVGRAHNIALATLPGFTLPGDISASERYWTEDIIDPPVTVGSNGMIAVPTAQGLGYTVVETRVRQRTLRRETVLG